MTDEELRDSNKLKDKVALLQVIFAVLSVCGCLVGSKMVPITLFGFMFITPASAFCYALTFFLLDTISEFSSRTGSIGKLDSFKAIQYGFFTQVVAAVLFVLVRMLPSSDLEYQEAYNTILGTSWILFGSSITAYLISGKVVTDLYSFLRKIISPGIANFISGQVGNLVDTITFTVLAFGLGHKLFFTGGCGVVLNLIVSQYLIKLLIYSMLSLMFPLIFRKHKEGT